MMRALFLALFVCLFLPLTAEARTPVAPALPLLVPAEAALMTGDVVSRGSVPCAKRAALVCPFAGGAPGAITDIPAIAPPRAISCGRIRPVAEVPPQRRGTAPPKRPPRLSA